jgi:hypothetical protein
MLSMDENVQGKSYTWIFKACGGYIEIITGGPSSNIIHCPLALCCAVDLMVLCAAVHEAHTHPLQPNSSNMLKLAGDCVKMRFIVAYVVVLVPLRCKQNGCVHGSPLTDIPDLAIKPLKR